LVIRAAQQSDGPPPIFIGNDVLLKDELRVRRLDEGAATAEAHRRTKNRTGENQSDREIADAAHEV
jgi:hypothetical protein